MNYVQVLTRYKAWADELFLAVVSKVPVLELRDILLHVVNHTTYHRGHAADILYNLHIFPPTTDLPVFLREQSVAA
jgi:DinB family